MVISACLQVFFNTQADQPRCGLQLTGELCLTPVRFFFNGSTIHEIRNSYLYTQDLTANIVLRRYAHLKDQVQKVGDPKEWKEGSWQQCVIPRIVQAAMAILFIPGLALGTILKLAAYILNTPAALLPWTPLQLVVEQQYNFVKDVMEEQDPAIDYSVIAEQIAQRNFANLSQSTRVLYKKDENAEPKRYRLYRIKYIDANDPNAHRINSWNDLQNIKSRRFISSYRTDPSVPPLEPIQYAQAPEGA